MTYNMNNYLMIKAHSHQEQSKSTPQLFQYQNRGTKLESLSE